MIKCKECICKPICKHKKITNLLKDCSIVFDTLYIKYSKFEDILKIMSDDNDYTYSLVYGWHKRRENFQDIIKTIYDALQPTQWSWVWWVSTDGVEIYDRGDNQCLTT